MRRLNFKVDQIPDIAPKEEKKKDSDKKVIENDNYIVSNEILGWVEKFGICDDILKEAQKRKDELNKALSEIE